MLSDCGCVSRSQRFSSAAATPTWSAPSCFGTSSCVGHHWRTCARRRRTMTRRITCRWQVIRSDSLLGAKGEERTSLAGAVLCCAVLMPVALPRLPVCASLRAGVFCLSVYLAGLGVFCPKNFFSPSRCVLSALCQSTVDRHVLSNLCRSTTNRRVLSTSCQSTTNGRVLSISCQSSCPEHALPVWLNCIVNTDCSAGVGTSPLLSSIRARMDMQIDASEHGHHWPP
jgi:hypothetical protein